MKILLQICYRCPINSECIHNVTFGFVCNAKKFAVTIRVFPLFPSCHFCWTDWQKGFVDELSVVTHDTFDQDWTY